MPSIARAFRISAPSLQPGGLIGGPPPARARSRHARSMIVPDYPMLTIRLVGHSSQDRCAALRVFDRSITDTHEGGRAALITRSSARQIGHSQRNDGIR
jgi:hypothetical protein